jgi:hypothetical protein
MDANAALHAVRRTRCALSHPAGSPGSVSSRRRNKVQRTFSSLNTFARWFQPPSSQYIGTEAHDLAGWACCSSSSRRYWEQQPMTGRAPRAQQWR